MTCTEANISVDEPDYTSKVDYIHLSCTNCGAEVISPNLFSCYPTEVEGPPNTRLRGEVCPAMVEVLLDIAVELYRDKFSWRCD